MKKKLVYIIACVAFILLLVTSETLLAYRLIKLDMLPNIYLAIAIGFLVIFALGVAALLLIHRKDMGVGIVRQIIAYFLTAVMIAGCLLVSPRLKELESTVKQITTNVLVTPIFNIYVENDDPAESIQDTAEYTFAALAQDEETVQKVLTAVEEEIQTTVSVRFFDDESLMITAYYNQEVDALILNGGYLSIWKENELYEGFGDKNRIIFSVKVDMHVEVIEIVQPEQTTPTEQPTEPEKEAEPDVTNTPFVVYISGMDGYSQNLTTTRSDVNILMVVNPVTKQVLMVNTPRDYYIVHPWGSGTRDKLTHCGIYGIECSVDALENLYNLPVDYYVQINYKGFENLIDAIGGVSVYSDFAFICGDLEDVYIPQGNSTLNGREALAFARDRKHQPNGDNDRGKNQMKVIKAVIAKVTSGRTWISNYSEILKSLEGMFATNMPSEDLSSLVKMQLTDMAQWNVMTYAVTGYDANKTTYSMPGTACYVMQPNQKSVDYAQELIQRVVNGEILTQEDMVMPK